MKGKWYLPALALVVLMAAPVVAQETDPEEVAVNQCDVAPAAFDELLAASGEIDATTRAQAEALNDQVKSYCAAGDTVGAQGKIDAFVVLLGIE